MKKVWTTIGIIYTNQMPKSALSCIVLVRYIEALVYQGIVENMACEQSSRMIAMKSATDNAGDMIKELGLIYNKARQAAITQEISEIVAWCCCCLEIYKKGKANEYR